MRDSSTGAVVFRCTTCGAEAKAGAKDARIGGAVHGAGETVEMYRNLIRNAPFDRTNQLVARDCAKCGRDYQVQIRVGASEVIIHRCKCEEEAPK